MADDCLSHFRECLECLFDPCLTVSAHHSFDFHCLFHVFVLLFFLIFFRLRCCGTSGICRPASISGRAAFFPALLILAGIVHPEQIQPQCIRDDAEAREAHRRRAEHRIQLPSKDRIPNTCCERNTDDVVNKCPKQVLVDVAQGRPAQADRRRDVT